MLRAPQRLVGHRWLAACAVALTCSAGASQVAEAAKPITIKPRAGTVALSWDASVVDLHERADGTVAVLTSEGTGGKVNEFGGGSLVSKLRLRTLTEAGEVGKAVTLPDPTTGRAGFLPDGSLLRTSYGFGRRKDHDGVEVGDATAEGRIVRSKVVVAKGFEMYEAGWQAGPTGAVLLWLNEGVGRGSHRTVAFRPAGAAAFGKPVRLGFFRGGDLSPKDFEGDGQDRDYEAAMARDGGAAIVAFPDSRKTAPATLRWVSPAGKVGPKLPLGLPLRGLTRGQVAYGPDGRLTILATAVRDTSRPRGEWRGAVFAATLAPGSTAPPTWQKLVDAGYDTIQRNLTSLATGPGGRVAALVSPDAHSLKLFEGDGGALAEAPAPLAVFPANLSLFADADGRLTAAWCDEASGDFEDEGVYVTARAAGSAAFAPPRRVTPKLEGELDGGFSGLDLARPLTGGRLVLVYREYFGNNGSSYTTIVQP